MAHSFYLPPEWEEQSAVMLTWPHRKSYWVDTLKAIDQVFAETALHISLRQKVMITCLDDFHERHIKNLLIKVGVDLAQVKIFQVVSNDIWVRDHGPLTVLENGKPRLLDFTFTGWGYKYPAEEDNVLTERLHQKNAFPDMFLQKMPMALEGGGIEVDGKGTLLATKSCLLSKIRNPELLPSEIEKILCDSLGLNRILWLTHGALEGDDTDGHIDTLARFTDPHTICYVKCDDPNDSHYETFQAMEAELRAFRDYQGNAYQLQPLPWPKIRFADVDGRRLPLSYANFLIINHAVLVPTYNDSADEEALAVVSECFPNREIIAIPALPVVQWYGSIHCMTMQLPRGVLT